MLTDGDRQYLAELGLLFTLSQEGGTEILILHGFPLPAGYTAPTSDLLLCLPPGYPDMPLDMWWFCPSVQLVSGGEIPQTQVSEVRVGRQWQRWSRHLGYGDWRPGVDDLRSYLARVRADLRLWATSCAA